MNFRLTRDQVVLLEAAANVRANRRKLANDFFAVFSSFELGGIPKHSTTGRPRGKQWVLFPLDLNVDLDLKQNSLFPLGPVIKWS